LLKRQFQRLSAVEEEVMYWLAINREPVSLAELAGDIVTSSSQRLVPSAIKSLLQRSLIEKSGEHFFLQPVVMEYATQRLVEQVCQELVGTPPPLRAPPRVRGEVREGFFKPML
jgi:hypothetical protein